MVWKICVPKINVGMCDKDPILQCYHFRLGPWIKSSWNEKAICQVVRIMWYTSLGHWVIECDNWDVHDKTIGTSSDPTSYDVLVVTTSNGEVHKGVNNNSNLTTTILANLWFGSMQLSTIHNVN
jgi:hypothetical protein